MSIGKKVAPPVLLQDYLAFLKEFDGKVWQYIALDVIRNKKETDRNLAIMTGLGLRPMPVFIEGYNAKDLERIMKANVRICVAGAVGSGDAYIEKRYRDVAKLAGGNAKIHGLGYGRYPNILKMPFSSSDSSSFNSGSRYGVIFRYLKGKKIDSIGWQDLVKGDDKHLVHKLDFMRYLAMNGVPFGKKFDRDWFKGKENLAAIPSMMGFFAYLQMMEECIQNGIDYFIAMPSTGFLLGVCAVIAAQREDGETFDYLLARELFIKNKANTDITLQFIIDTLKATQWKQLPHSK